MDYIPSIESRICPSCERLLADDAAFCERCGQEVKYADKQTLHNSICPNCRLTFSGGPKTHHCSQCGGKLIDLTQRLIDSNKQFASKFNSIAFFIFFLIISIVVVAFAVQKLKQFESAPSSNVLSGH